MPSPGLNSMPPSTHSRQVSQPPDPDLNTPSTAPTNRASHVMGPPPMPVNGPFNITHDPVVPGPGPGENFIQTQLGLH